MIPVYKFVEITDEHSQGTLTLTVVDGNKQELEIYRCPVTNSAFAVDSSWLASNDGRFMVSPYDPSIIYDFGCDEEESPEDTVDARNQWLDEEVPQ